MGRIKIEVNESVLRQCVSEAEKREGVVGHVALCDVVASIYNDRMNPVKPLTGSVVYLRLKEFNIPINIPKAKRGRQSIGGANSANRGSRADKFASNPAIVKSINAMRAATASRFLPVIDAIEGGSMKAAIKAKCLDCTCEQTLEIRECPAIECPLWPFRPYQ